MKFFKILTVILTTIILISANKNKLEKKEFFENEIFTNNIKAIITQKNQKTVQTPLINLNSKEKINISFDDLDGDVKSFYYTIIHCNSNWTKSQLMKSEYITGFHQKEIINYDFSFNTIQKYTHYQFTFPNTDIKPKLSGNYILIIYNEKDEKVAQKKIMVLDNKTIIKAKVKRATLFRDRETKHEVDFDIAYYNNLIISDPINEIKVTITQNNRTDNCISNLKPIYYNENKLTYDYEEENTFYANNEFRHFDTRSLRYLSSKIEKIDFDTNYNVYLFEDNVKSFDLYSIEPDINGGFFINCQEAWNSEIEADYTWVHFSLNTKQMKNRKLYIIGEFCDWKIREENKLNYNHKKNIYENAIYLKQGYYNYQYAVVENNLNKLNTKIIEGSHYQTKNDYYIYVYQKAFDSRYEKLIGYKKTSSKELF
tara:strand:+ start:23 stop:1300 length:1278 start_codon:yes stop_codon:yes gene_type:complete